MAEIEYWLTPWSSFICLMWGFAKIMGRIRLIINKYLINLMMTTTFQIRATKNLKSGRNHLFSSGTGIQVRFLKLIHFQLASVEMTITARIGIFLKILSIQTPYKLLLAYWAIKDHYFAIWF